MLASCSGTTCCCTATTVGICAPYTVVTPPPHPAVPEDGQWCVAQEAQHTTHVYTQPAATQFTVDLAICIQIDNGTGRATSAPLSPNNTTPPPRKNPPPAASALEPQQHCVWSACCTSSTCNLHNSKCCSTSTQHHPLSTAAAAAECRCHQQPSPAAHHSSPVDFFRQALTSSLGRACRRRCAPASLTHENDSTTTSRA